MIVHYHSLYVFTHRDVSAAEIFRVMVSHEMKETFIPAFPVRVSQMIHPFFILHLIRASSRWCRTSLRRGSS